MTNETIPTQADLLYSALESVVISGYQKARQAELVQGQLPLPTPPTPPTPPPAPDAPAAPTTTTPTTDPVAIVQDPTAVLTSQATNEYFARSLWCDVFTKNLSASDAANAVLEYQKAFPK